MATDDPFERAVAREARLRERAASLDTRAGTVRFVTMWFGVLGAGWIAILAAHWLVFPDPRWLAVAHTVAFVLVGGYWLVGFAFMISMKRRRPDLFEFGDE